VRLGLAVLWLSPIDNGKQSFTWQEWTSKECLKNGFQKRGTVDYLAIVATTPRQRMIFFFQKI
jgi:hypothetical protein